MSDNAWSDRDGQLGDALESCLLDASAAPSIHNTQPWMFRPRVGYVDVLIDRRYHLAALDPDGREMFVSVGAAVFNLRLAICARGRSSRAVLMPDPAEPDLAARIALGPPTAPAAGTLALAEAIGRRHTNRWPFADRPVPYAVMQELAAAAEVEDATVFEVDPPLRDGVLSLTQIAETQMRVDDCYRAELATWTTPGGVGCHDGVPRKAFGPRDMDEALPLRDFALTSDAPTTTVAFEPDPTLILLYASGDRPMDWLQAGAALQRVLLVATLRGLAATPLTQLLEVPRLRALLADSINERVLQSVLRIGYPTTEAAPTPRRRLSDLILFGGECHVR